MPPRSRPTSSRPSSPRDVAADMLRSAGALTAWPVPPNEDMATMAYLALIEDPQPSRSSLTRAGFDEAGIDRLLALLQEGGLIVIQPDGTLEVPPPDAAIPVYAAELDRHARTSLAAMHGLTQLYHRARATPEGEGIGRLDVKVLTSVEDLDRVRHQLASQATIEAVRACARSDRTDRSILEQAQALADGSIEPPSVPSRLIVDSSLLEVPGALEALSTLAEHGIHVRLLPQVVCNLAVIDRRTALIDVTNIDTSAFGSVLVRNQALVEVIVRLLEQAFQSALLLPRASAGEEIALFDERDAQILALMAAGATDTTIARQVRISQRTVERRMRTIMDALGAGTRFQAGVLAARRGLV